MWDPPQRNGAGSWTFARPTFDGIDGYFVTDETNLNEMDGYFDTDETAQPLFEKIPFRNKLLWMEDNPFTEELCSFNRWAWRSQTEGGRTIALGSNSFDWTIDVSAKGLSTAPATPGIRAYLALQMSPCEKYFKLFLGHPYAPEGLWGACMTFYVVQKGDIMHDHCGQNIVQAGDLLRISYRDVSKDPYMYRPRMYRPRVVDELDEESGEIKTDFAAYDELIEKVNASPPEGMTNVDNLNVQERFALIFSNFNSFFARLVHSSDPSNNASHSFQLSHVTINID